MSNQTTVTEISVDGSGPLGVGDAITFTLTTDQPVTVNGTPELALSNGGRAVYAGTDENGGLTFTYTVTDGDGDTSDLSVISFDTSDGTIDDLVDAVTLEAQTPVSTGNSPYSIATGDLNGDGKLDMLVVNQGDDTVSVRLGNGDGIFSSAADVAVGGGPTSVATADVDGDGKLDMLVANQADNTVSVRLGNGDGTFSAQPDVAVGSTPSSVVTGDFNGDGSVDLVVANSGSSSVSVILGNGDGTFSTGENNTVGGTPYFVATGDFNDDGELDLVTANAGGGSVSVLLGNGDGTFSANTDYPAGPNDTSVTVGDLDEDGNLDLLTVNYHNDTLSVLLGNGDGVFHAGTTIGMTGDPIAAALADFNGDGTLDFLAVKYYDNAIAVVLGNGDGTFSNQTDINIGNRPVAVTMADVDGDGTLDALLANRHDNTVSVLLNMSGLADVTGADTGISVDATAPDAPELALSDDSGASTSDRVTNSAILSIIQETGATLSYVVDGGQASSSYDPTALEDGEHTVTVTQADAIGNISTSGSITFTLDQTAPDAPVITLTTDSGSSDSDKITSSAALTIDGTENDATISYVVDGGTASGTFDPTDLSDGDHTVSITQTDVAGNVSSGGTLTFTLDRGAPDVEDLAVTGSGISNGSGTLAAGQTAQFHLTLGEAVSIADADQLTLSLSNGALATFDQAASTDTVLVFAYTVSSGDMADDLAVTDVNLNEATVTDSAGNEADLTGAIGDLEGTLVINGHAGTRGDDDLRGTHGDDLFKGRAGNDRFFGAGGDDRLSGGAGADRLNGAHGADKLYGGVGNDRLLGGGEHDTLWGGWGNDTLLGQAGNDILIGGKGADRLAGGTGRDIFLFNNQSDSVMNSAGRDTITDFHTGDRIDLSAIDADSRTEGNQSFTFIGTDRFSGKAGELCYFEQASDTYVYADTDGDKRADFSLRLDDAIELAARDFIL